MTTTPPRRPPAFSVGEIRCNAVRAPRAGVVGWYWRATRPIGAGRRETVWVGWGTPEQALQAVARLRGEGRAAPAAVSESPDVVTVGDLLAYYIGAAEERHEAGDLAARSVVVYRNQAKHLNRLIGHVHLDRLDARHLGAYRDKALAGGRAPVSVRTDLTTLQAAWRWGQERGLCDARVLGRVRVTSKARVYTDHTPSRSEFWLALDALEARRAGRSPEPLLVLRLLAATGMRIREACDLLVEDVNLARRSVRVRLGKTPRTVPLAPAALEVLAALVGDRTHGRLWGRSCDALVGQVQRCLETLDWEALGQRRFSPHGVRRMVVIELWGSGVDPAVAARILGHSPEVAMRHYRQVSEADMGQALALTGLGERGPSNVIALRRRGGGA